MGLVSRLLGRLDADRRHELVDVGAAAMRALDRPVPVVLLEALLLVEGLRAGGALELVHRHGWTSRYRDPAAPDPAPALPIWGDTPSDVIGPRRSVPSLPQ